MSWDPFPRTRDTDHRDAPMTPHGKRLFYGFLVALVVIGSYLVAVSR